MTQTYQDFLDQIAQKESSFLTRTNSQDSYTLENKFGYLGKYQMGEAALIDAGYYKPNDGTKVNDYKGAWAGKNGINSKYDFLNSQFAQEDAIKAFYDKTWTYITNLNLDYYVGQHVGGVDITESGLVAGAHLVGVGGLVKFIKSGGSVVLKDGNGTPITTYLSALSGYDVPFIPISLAPIAPTSTSSYPFYMIDNYTVILLGELKKEQYAK